MAIKKHLEGGTLRQVMVAEISRVLTKYSEDSQFYERAALELGITPRTLRVWTGPVKKGGWAELQPEHVVEQVLGILNEKGKQKKRSSKTA